MAFPEFQSILPILPASQPEIEVLESHQLTRNFYQEVAQREEFNKYCQWYYQTSAKHQQELQKMRGDVNIFGWFLGRR